MFHVNREHAITQSNKHQDHQTSKKTRPHKCNSSLIFGGNVSLKDVPSCRQFMSNVSTKDIVTHLGRLFVRRQDKNARTSFKAGLSNHAQEPIVINVLGSVNVGLCRVDKVGCIDKFARVCANIFIRHSTAVFLCTQHLCVGLSFMIASLFKVKYIMVTLVFVLALLRGRHTRCPSKDRPCTCGKPGKG